MGNAESAPMHREPHRSHRHDPPHTRRVPRSLVVRGGQLLDAAHAQGSDLTEVKNAWRAFKGWDLGSKLSLGMVLSVPELDYLIGQLRKLPACFRPSKLHFWDNNTHTATTRPLDSEHRGRTLELLQLCQTSVREVEWHGFGGAPPWERLDMMDHEHEDGNEQEGNSSQEPQYCFTHLECARFYHLNLTGGRSGRVLRQLFFGQSRIHTLYLARCRLDLDMLEELGRGLAHLPCLKTLVFVHCQMTDDMLELLLHRLAESRRQPPQVPLENPPVEANVAIPEAPEDMLHPLGHNGNNHDIHHDNNHHDNPPLLDLCVHANHLTVRSIDVLAHFLEQQHDLLRSVTLHANPHIDGLLTSNHGECPELSHFLEVLQTHNTSLRHFSWHNCLSTGHVETTTTANTTVCEPCQQMALIFQRNRWLALSQKLCCELERSQTCVWPYLLETLTTMEGGTTALWSLLVKRNVEFAAIRCTDVQHFLRTTHLELQEEEEDNKDRAMSLSQDDEKGRRTDRKNEDEDRNKDYDDCDGKEKSEE